MCCSLRGALEGWVLHVLMLPPEVCPQYLLCQVCVSYLSCFPGILGFPALCPVLPSKFWSEPVALWPGHSLFCPAALATSLLCLSPLPAAPGLSSKVPVVWWQHVPSHSLTSFLFLVSPMGQRVEGDQPSCVTHQKGYLAMPMRPNAPATGSPLRAGGCRLLVTQREGVLAGSKQPTLELVLCPVYQHHQQCNFLPVTSGMF